jgi:GNAT superfamily N-acetyltransferase
MADEFSIRQYQPEDESAVLTLIQEGMGGGPTGKRDEAFWRWKHYQNPFGPSISLVAVSTNGKIIGLRTFMRWRFQAANTMVNAVRAVDTVTHPEYRRYGVFSALTRQAVEQVKKNGIDLIFNTPNNQVLPGYLKLGWHYVSLVKPLVKVLNYPRFAYKLMRSRGKSRASGPLSAEQVFKQKIPSMAEFLSHEGAIEQLLRSQKQNRNERLFTDQSLGYLKWRYSEHPYIDYKVIYLEKNGVLSGCLILRPSTRFGLKEIVINELLLPGSDKSMASSLMKELKRFSNADYIIAYFHKDSFQRHVLQKHGFFQVPAGGQNYAVNPLTPGLKIDPLVLGNWDISLGDLEVF